MQKTKTVNPERAEIFTNRHANENEIIDLSILHHQVSRHYFFI